MMTIAKGLRLHILRALDINIVAIKHGLQTNVSTTVIVTHFLQRWLKRTNCTNLLTKDCYNVSRHSHTHTTFSQKKLVDQKRRIKKCIWLYTVRLKTPPFYILN